MAAELDIFSPTSSAFLTHKREFSEFLDQDDEGSAYQRKIIDMLEQGRTRLFVDLDDLRNFNPDLAERFMLRPMDFFAPWQSALKEYINVLPEQPFKTDIEQAVFRIGVDGNFGANRVDPRNLKAIHVGHLMCVEGIVTRCSIVRPKVSKTVHYCHVTSAHSTQVYHDATSITGFPTGSAYPTKDSDGHALETEYGLSEYTDTQSLTIQEMPERAPPGLLPKSVDVVLEMDLVDTCKPGDRVMIAGIYRALPGASQGETTGAFRTVLIANMVQGLGKAMQGSATNDLSEKDIKRIREVSRREDVFDLLGKSIAPSIYGQHYIKKALVLLLLGGVEKNLDNGTHIRGDVNMMMIGDPSTAKSQILRFALNVAPLAINTTGRGSSGVGLTAAVLQDPDTGERKLEAGAMVLADRGIVCIDEFDKMSDNDRVSIHEVMEQQTVTIAKAGIHMSLNARCSVIAAANPAYGQYDRSLAPSKNINMPDSLLSRFDLLFIVLDQPDPEMDRDISDRVIRNHRFISKHGDRVAEETNSNAEDETTVYQRYDKLLHGGLAFNKKKGKLDLLTIPFLKKYMKFAKETYRPALTIEAAEFVGQAYKELRHREMSERALPVTARALETLIRLSSAHAKARLAKKVTLRDAEVALEVLKFAMENDTSVQGGDDSKGDDSKAQSEAAKDKPEGGDDRPDDDDGDDGRPPPALPPPAAADSSLHSPSQPPAGTAATAPHRSPRKRAPARPQGHPSHGSRKAAKARGNASPAARALVAVPGSRAELREERIAAFKESLAALFVKSRAHELGVEEVVEFANSTSNIDYSRQEADLILEALEDDNKCMLSDGKILRI